MIEERSAQSRARELERTHRDLLERRRILLGDPEAREKLIALRAAFTEFQRVHPEVAGLGVCGSRILGYADKISDFDLRLAIDFSRLSALGRGPSRGEIKALSFEATSFFAERLGIPQERFDIQAYLVDVESPGIMVLTPDPFLLSFGDMRPYREALINRIEHMGEGKDEWWRSLMKSLSDWEGRDRFSPSLHKRRFFKLYPQTLAEARKYFLRGKRDDFEGIDRKPSS